MHSARGNEIKEAESLNYYEFNNDGTYMNRFEGMNYGGSWTLDEKNKTIGFEHESVNLNGIYKLTKNILTLELNRYYLDKKDEEFGIIKIELERVGN